MDQTSETEKLYQRSKYDDVINIIINAGYYRARINTLSEFDKVVGGICWLIMSSGEILDVDILFQENSTIGQKITLSEALVKALRKMDCPAPLQPHQIQGGVGGSDYPALYQVIVWLVKKFHERRIEKEQQLRSFSNFQFDKNYQLPSETGSKTVSDIILNRSKATRLFRRTVLSSESEETRVRSCLLEFGESFTDRRFGFATMDRKALSVSSVNNIVTTDNGLDFDNIDSHKSSLPQQQSSIAALAASSVHNRAARLSSVNNSINNSSNTNSAERQKLHIPLVDSVDMTLSGLSKLEVTELSSFEKQLARAAREAKIEEAQLSQERLKEEEKLRGEMREVGEHGGLAVTGSQVGNIVGLGLGEMGSAYAAYQAEVEDARKQLDNSLANGKLGQSAVFNRQKQHLIKQRDEQMTKEREMRATCAAVKQRLQLIEEERTSAVEYIGQLQTQLKKLQGLEAMSTQQEELKIVQSLVGKHDALKKEEVAFKAACKAQRQEYLDKITVIDAELDENTAENAKLRDVEEMHTKVM